jgi:hypothetical protein
MRLDIAGFVVGTVGVLVGVAGVAIAIGSGSGSGVQEPITRVTVTAEPEDQVAAQPAATVTVTVAPPAPETTEPPRPKPLPAKVGDGVYLVGKDIPAGTWRNQGGRLNGAPCLAYASSKPQDLNTYLRGTTSEGPGIVMVNKGEYFNVQYCMAFTLQG